MAQADFAKSDFVLVLMMSGVDETLHDTVYQQFEYTYENLRWGAKFSPVISWDRLTNCIELDFAHISTTMPAPIKEDPNVGDLQVVVDTGSNTATPSNETEGNIETTPDLDDCLENVEDGDQEQDAKLLRRYRSFLSPSTDKNRDVGVDYSDLESISSYREDVRQTSSSPAISSVDVVDTTNDDTDEDGERKSSGSTRTNSGSENDERHETTPVHHVRFDKRSRTTSFRLPRVGHRRRGRNNRLESTGSTWRHAHEVQPDLHDEPMSLRRRRFRFKNHPLSRFSKGLYYRALETSWLRVFVYLAFIYFAAIAVMALLMDISVRANYDVIDRAVVHTAHELVLFCSLAML
jgi:hypothetical protein